VSIFGADAAAPPVFDGAASSIDGDSTAGANNAFGVASVVTFGVGDV
jgi:hypothetical protein